MTITKVAADHSAADENKQRVAALAASEQESVKQQIARLASESAERMSATKESDTMSATTTTTTTDATTTPAAIIAAAPAKRARATKSASATTTTTTKQPAKSAPATKPAKQTTSATKPESEQQRLARVAAEQKKRTPAQVRADAARIASERKQRQQATKSKSSTPRVALGARTLGGTRIGGATPRNGTVGYRLLNCDALTTKRAISRDAWLAAAGVADDEPYRQAIAHLRYGLRVLRTFAADGKTEMYTRVADALAYGADANNVKSALAKREPVAKPAKSATTKPATKSAPAKQTTTKRATTTTKPATTKSATPATKPARAPRQRVTNK